MEGKCLHSNISSLFNQESLVLFTKRDPNVLQCIYHTLDSGRDKYVENHFLSHTLHILCTYFFVAMETGVSNSVLVTALKRRSTILDKVS